MTAYAYLRKSHVNPAMNHVSWEMQEEAVRALAARHGDDDLVILSDWSRSGRGSKTGNRPEYLRLKALITAGQASALYSYSLSRLARSTKELLDLAEVCAAAGVPVRLAKEGEQDITTSHGRLYLTVLAAVSTFEAEVAGERARDAVAERQARGDRLGVAPYGAMAGESIERIVEAYQAAGSCFGAARALNGSGSRTRRGAMWSSKVVGDVLRRAGVTYKARPHAGAKDAAEWITYRLLTCACGNVMTAMDRRSPRVTCYKARGDGGHARPHGIAESKLLPALMAEAAHLRMPEAVEMPADDHAERAALEARRLRVLDMYEAGDIDRADYARRVIAVADAVAALDASRIVSDVPDAVDWAWTPRRLNSVLRAIWETVELGPDMTIARFVWRVPEWRS